MNEDKPISREELRKLRPSMRNIYILQKQHLVGAKKFANWVTKKVGTMGFFYLILLWAAIWMIWNTFGPSEMIFDHSPDFFIFVFLATILTTLLMPLIMVGQNLQETKANARAEADFELNKIEEKEIDTVLHHLENQNRHLLSVAENTDKILTHLEKQNDLIINILNELKNKNS